MSEHLTPPTLRGVPLLRGGPLNMKPGHLIYGATPPQVHTHGWNVVEQAANGAQQNLIGWFPLHTGLAGGTDQRAEWWMPLPRRTSSLGYFLRFKTLFGPNLGILNIWIDDVLVANNLDCYNSGGYTYNGLQRFIQPFFDPTKDKLCKVKLGLVGRNAAANVNSFGYMHSISLYQL